VHFSVAELGDLGVKRISVGSALARAAVGASSRRGAKMIDHGTFTFGDSAMPMPR